MDISKLQIGDFVKYADEIVKVIGILTDNTYSEWYELVVTNKDNKPYSLGHLYNEFDEISPIAITEKFLEDNGFKRIDTTIGNYALAINVENVYDENDYSTWEFERISTYLQGGYFDGLFEIENRVKGEYSSCRVNCKYIHELQQALRLMGTDLELTIKEDE